MTLDPLGFWIVKNNLYLGVIIVMSLNPLLKSVNKRVSNMIFMLRKIRKFITFDAAILIYKQTILPIIEYAGFMRTACNSEAKENMQILQNNILRICCRYKHSDKISIERLHTECKISSIEKHMQKQLLWLRFVLPQNGKYHCQTTRDTQNALKINFKVPDKITHLDEQSPYYIGTKSWNKLPEMTQKAEN